MYRYAHLPGRLPRQLQANLLACNYAGKCTRMMLKHALPRGRPPPRVLVPPNTAFHLPPPGDSRWLQMGEEIALEARRAGRDAAAAAAAASAGWRS